MVHCNTLVNIRCMTTPVCPALLGKVDKTWRCCRRGHRQRLRSGRSDNSTAGASENMWIMPRRSEMVGWRERSCCALSGGRDEGEREMEAGGTERSLRGLELGTDGAVLAIVQPSPSSFPQERREPGRKKNTAARSVSQHRENE